MNSLNDLSFDDTLTGLPNRLRFLLEVDDRLRGSRNADATVAMVDIDAFAETNDALGHEFGDKLLRAVAQRLRVRLPGAFIARVAGDTFGLLGESSLVAPRVVACLFEEPYCVEGQEIRISATHGYVNLGEHEGNGADALRNASFALIRAKSTQRGNYSMFTRTMDIEIMERVRMLHGLRSALNEDRLFLMYQPQVRIDGGQPVGVEALIRWRADDGRFVPPDRFIPLAEHAGLIVDIGSWVLRQACYEQAKIAAAGFPNMRMAVNVSAVQFRHPRFIEQVRDALHETGATAGQIELEFTPTMPVEALNFVENIRNELAGIGVKLAIDGFGTGFSSMSALQRLRVDRLKLDRSLLPAQSTNPNNGHQIVEMMIQLGHKLGVAALAVGVEETEQANMLLQLGCQEAQGYLYGRPMEPAALYAWLAERRNAT
ncbi:putative bifunctional diguanylate cyclase/phosphodiesterase [Niveibacterium umoris]|uniref:Diguanylate cyclase (GGDEF)-like protein n=1 Tax=Niveibacterium umoris TaxID=1193620 RepID=A0A840BMF8_9RHOO|nr:bifunctional diguanylate cyclase/phosphodiesterase [Niveibacterium umoris]MBB4014721.1 diguanylate cyclase (GGDEF)-like protein [Niveibacterium umoris]